MLFQLLRLAFKNAFRHKLRTGLTVLGLTVAILSFGLLRTVVDAWHAGVDAASDSRLITRNSVSLVFFLPLHYADKVRQVPGVHEVGYATWFGGIYIEEKNFFPNFAIDGEHFLNLYPEFVIAEEERKAFLRDKQGAVVGRKLAKRFGWKVGDVVPLRGTIFPGTWSFVVRAIYDGAKPNTDTSQFMFHWSLLDDTVRKSMPRRGGYVGWLMVGIDNPQDSAQVARNIDRVFKNSLAETLTETEKAFQQGFVAMTGAIVMAIEVVSFVVIAIIMAVMANTMIMAARERSGEYATLKALGFGPGFLAALIFAESLAICALGGAFGVALTFPVARAFAKEMEAFLPVFLVSDTTIAMQWLAALAIACAAAAIPAWRAARVKIVDGLRSVG
ncbi:MAG: ABC transporter permease [Sulfuricella sp.]|nr:ABC transporter permease [Sulfuricella sp.]